MQERLGIEHNTDMTLPADQVIALQHSWRAPVFNRGSELFTLHVAIARRGNPASAKGDLDQA